VTGRIIKGLDAAAEVDGAYVLHAGTKLAAYQTVMSSGGRVLSVVGVGTDLAEARERAYEAVDLVVLPGSHYRSDIALAAELGEITVP
jgi:phosphoribosylamine--glycine ligase